MNADLFDDRRCSLGEGPLWHPERGQLFWFDILAGRLLTRTGDGPAAWDFDQMVSACGWVDHDHLLVASETRLFLFNLVSGAEERVCDLEGDNALTRSNDGRADPYGGFWIGTMGKKGEDHAGAIYRFYRGELRRLYDRISISNAICFAPDGRHAYFTDTRTQRLMRVALDGEGWPAAEADCFIDFRADDLDPDGAVVDAVGNLWVAQWGASRVAVYGPDGDFLFAEAFGAPHLTCPAFGGREGQTLYVTSARCELDEAGIAQHPLAGSVFQRDVTLKGQREHKVQL
ncbi:SMP-30/gluconolactonase/LRE family protein [Cohaesibacter intestini]|uniref:SMP-30/gluconolactonase/LRE family protein n=1 Tax=Cohaesibacter intestini TaxID=2211145 RepID=UPI000DE9499C|nr:SMP-30/gluconolactonase/LRE family protein [Cohaesibacter intestini]